MEGAWVIAATARYLHWASRVTDDLLVVDNLRAGFQADDSAGAPHLLEVLDGVSFRVRAGATLGLVGESGCGKSVFALSVMRLLPKPAGAITAGSIYFAGRDLVQLPAADMASVRGRRIAMIFQEPMTAMNPVQRIGRQIEEMFKRHLPALSARDRRARVLTLLQRVGIPAAEQRLDDYPHQLSGGMRQRIMIAMALALDPALLLADEPTTALDVTIQAQILELIKELQRTTGMAVVFITHDLGVVAEVCDDVAVMYAGRIVETAPVNALFAAPLHPYTRGLLACIPRLDSEPKQTLPVIPGIVPPLDAMPAGCRFAGRCDYYQPSCDVAPPLRELRAAHRVACVRASAWST